MVMDEVVADVAHGEQVLELVRTTLGLAQAVVPVLDAPDAAHLAAVAGTLEQLVGHCVEFGGTVAALHQLARRASLGPALASERCPLHGQMYPPTTASLHEP